MSTVLVTGGTGFVGSHVILQLLVAGHRVRTTVRDRSREAAVRAMLKEGSVTPGDALSFCTADLNSDAGWAEAVANCDFVHHVASPFPMKVPKDENELIVPARDGALRVLRASRDAGVKRVVLTSSFAAIGYGHPPRAKLFDETDWTDLTSREVFPYQKSKTIAERAAWDFVAKEGGALELAVVNPVGIFGPALGPALSTSVVIVQMMMNGALPGVPKIHAGAVAGPFLSLHELGQILRRRLGPAAKRVPTRELPNMLMHLVALFDSTMKQTLPELGVQKGASNEKAKRVLGWTPRSTEEAIVATAESLVQLGLLKDSAKKAA